MVCCITSIQPPTNIFLNVLLPINALTSPSHCVLFDTSVPCLACFMLADSVVSTVNGSSVITASDPSVYVWSQSLKLCAGNDLTNLFSGQTNVYSIV